MLLFFLLMFSSVNVFAKQSRSPILPDTLAIYVSIPTQFDEATRWRIEAAVDSLVVLHNQNDRALKFIRTATASQESVSLLWGAPQLSPKQRSYWITGVNVLLLGANVLIFPYFAPIIPFYFIPIAKCDLTIQEQIDWLVIENEETVHCSAYFRNAEKQYARLTETIVEDVDAKMRQWQRQYERKMKRQG